MTADTPPTVSDEAVEAAVEAYHNHRLNTRGPLVEDVLRAALAAAAPALTRHATDTERAAAETAILMDRKYQAERIAAAIEAAYEEWRTAGDESLPDAPLMHSTQWFVERTYRDAARIARAGGLP